MESSSNLTLLSRIDADNRIEIWLEPRPLAPLAPGEVLVRVEAAPVNPSDLGLLLASADMATATRQGQGRTARVTAALSGGSVRPFAGRIGKSLPIGNEGAGTIVDAAADVRHRIGQKVAMMGGAMYAQYRTMAARDCLVLPPEATAAQGSALFVNPLTALGMVETMRSEGHAALVHTAAASNLGQMLVRICLADNVGLVNIVRSEEQADALRQIGAAHVLNSQSPDFRSKLTEAIATTGATIAFDAVGGGRLANTILHAMEAAALQTAQHYSLYGTERHKQIYIYGSLDMSVSELDRGYGMSWGIGAFLVTRFLQKLDAHRLEKLHQRIVNEYATTFASHYAATVSLADMLDPDTLRAMARRGTGGKYLLDATL